MGMSGVDGTGAAAARFLEPRRLQPGEELGSFSCSVELIDDWAAKHASYAAKQGTAVPYVCFTTDGDVAGFYAIRIKRYFRLRMIFSALSTMAALSEFHLFYS
jgi:hypothetical protein